MGLKILVTYRQDIWNNQIVEKYARSVCKEILALGHQVKEAGPGHIKENFVNIPFETYDHIIELETGRDDKGEFSYLVPKSKDRKVKLPKTSVYFIDSHGHPSLHKRYAEYYDNVFFAVWSRRDLFAKHPSAHFLPNATDFTWFGYENFLNLQKQYHWGFFGSKGGLHRADILKAACEKYELSYRICQINRPQRHMWPATGMAMAECHYLFNHGQKHDINQRIFESMAARRPLLNDVDSTSGIEKLFTEGKHFIGYTDAKGDFEEKFKWVIEHPVEVAEIAKSAYFLCKQKHQVKHRVKRMLDVITR